MTRNYLLGAVAIALATALPAHQQRAVAQDSTDASAEANQSTSGSSSDASADAQQSSSNRSDAQSARNNSSNQSSSDQSQNSQQRSRSSTNRHSSDSDSPAFPAPSRRSNDYDRNRDDDREMRDRDSRSRDSDSDSPNRDMRDRDNRNRDYDRNRDDRRFDDRDRGDWDRSRRDRDDRRFDDRGRRDRDFDSRRGIRFGRATDRGLSIQNIERNTLYYDSGLRSGDVIISFHGEPIRSEADYRRYVSRYHGERVPVVVLRDGERETIYIEYPEQMSYSDRDYDNRRGGQAYLGVFFDTQVREAAVIRRVTPGSPADEAGLRSGDMILSLNGQDVRSYQEAISIVHSMRPGDQLDIVVERGSSEGETQAVLRAQPRTTSRNDTHYESDRQPNEGEIVVQPRRGDVEYDRRYDNRRYDDRRIFDGDRDEDGYRDRGLLQRVLD